MANCIVSETLMSWTLRISKSSVPQNISKRARDLFILIDPLIICIHFRSNQLPFSLSISTAASQIREKLVITPVYLKLRSRFMQLSLHSQNSGYTLFQLFQDIISHERRYLSFIFKILKMIYY